jgi:hypothetical protein
LRRSASSSRRLLRSRFTLAFGKAAAAIAARKSRPAKTPAAFQDLSCTKPYKELLGNQSLSSATATNTCTI